MAHEDYSAPWIAKGEPKELGITHGTTEAGPVGDFPFAGASLPETTVDLTTKEAAAIPDVPGLAG